ncbi:hypothetical protein H6P81_021420 [Aristolochia fimbriata]|uniref:Uncharacterized protein n=1 Tax=Aristolochia fimbriata TaxID=158543 RepID=A0AAV7DQY6_ARIFI|nr:hypothetical protein H6P81_021420 [Aristolochia fimbriata]
MSSADRPRPRRAFEPKGGAMPRPPTNGIILSRLFDASKAPPRGPLPVRPPPGIADDPPRQGSSSLEQSTDSRRVRLGPPAQPSEPILFPGYGSILPTSLAYIVPSTRGCSPWRPDAVMSTTRRMHGTRSSGFSRVGGRTDTTRRGGCSSSRWTLPPAEPLPGWAGC